ncbi:MAG TPA: PEMT/PEM2 methyltransferase family protein [Bacteroidota bacterium]|nr:PEMT/PEM2 methyltransferase family protein [Bacteroidota bacterium]
MTLDILWLSALKALSDLIPGPSYAWTVLAIAGRLAYVGYIWVMLSRQVKDPWSSKDRRQRAYRNFRRGAVIVMNLDAILFIVATVRNANEIPAYHSLLLSVGIVLLLIGIVVKIAAFKALGSHGYYWGDFFLPEKNSGPVRKGIYRHLKNPMYDAGYLHAYGFACICFSWTGLALAGLMQLTIKLFGRFLETPNFHRVYGNLQQRVDSETGWQPSLNDKRTAQ